LPNLCRRLLCVCRLRTRQSLPRNRARKAPDTKFQIGPDRARQPSLQKARNRRFPWIAEQRPVFAPFQWSWNSAFQEVRRATPDSHKGDDVLSIGMSRLSLLTIPRTLYYCLGNTSELRIDPNRSSKAVQGQRPVRVGPSPLIRKFFRTCDSTSTRSKTYSGDP
jgi:hypothetical protein